MGTPCELSEARSTEELWDQRHASNAQLLRTIKEDQHADKLYEAAEEDARLGRMTAPVWLKDADLDGVRLCLLAPGLKSLWRSPCCSVCVRLAPRFSVAKTKEDGSVSVRPIDNFSWSEPPAQETGKKPTAAQKKALSVNGHSSVSEKMHHDHLDKLAEMERYALDRTGVVFGLYKADIDAAFRRIPLRVDHLWACVIVASFMGQVRTLRLLRGWWRVLALALQIWISTHKCCPFGAVSAVHAWERIGALLAHIARKTLKLSILRYVDDFFGCERCDEWWPLEGGSSFAPSCLWQLCVAGQNV